MLYRYSAYVFRRFFFISCSALWIWFEHTQSFFTIIQAYCFSNLFEHLFKNLFIFRFVLVCLNFYFSLWPCNFYAFINNLISLAELIKWKKFFRKNMIFVLYFNKQFPLHYVLWGKLISDYFYHVKLLQTRWNWYA